MKEYRIKFLWNEIASEWKDLKNTEKYRTKYRRIHNKFYKNTEQEEQRTKHRRIENKKENLEENTEGSSLSLLSKLKR